MKTSDIGLVGLAVMGENLALNMAGHGYTVSLYNRHGEVVTRFVEGRGKGKGFIPTYSIAEFVATIARPRKIILMIKAGAPVDEMIAKLMPFLSPGDIIIDGGNSDFRDTERRMRKLESHHILYVGAGISGGEEGALHGPSIMPGGSPGAWPEVKNILQDISAKLDDGTPCCQWIGKGGAGHFVKMVHNGIEYGDMQLIAEAYRLLKERLHLDNEQLHAVFSEWNEGELKSYLIEITAAIVNFRDNAGGYLLDKILDAAGQKGTGKWSVMEALEENDPLTLITESVYARMLSALLEEREKASCLFLNEDEFPGTGIDAGSIGEALYASKLVSYTQGFSLLRRASFRYDWHLDFGTIARIWRKGCIIRSVFLGKITDAYTEEPGLANLLFNRFFRSKILDSLASWRSVVADGVLSGVALPCMSSALSYFDGLRTLNSPANLIQAQRDYFGAHLYERIDKPRNEFFHTDWTGEGGDTTSRNYNV